MLQQKTTCRHGMERIQHYFDNSLSGDSEEESVSQFFHILGSVDQQRGCCEVAEGNMRLPCIHPVAMPRKVFITTIPMKSTRSVE